MRFTLIDRIVSLDPGKSITAIKNLSLAEEYLADHFPGFPVMPGVLMIESLVQAGAWLMRRSEDFQYSTVLLKQARAVKFSSFVTPGRTLSVTTSVHEWNGSCCVLKGAGNVDGKQTVSARLTLERFNLAERNPELASADAYQIRKSQELFQQLWSEPVAESQP
jgi:3-hydroxyacyl-[acyl-carrier-protein] dehydratase